MATPAKIYSVLGTTDSVTDCDCCGRTGLKSTIVLRNVEADTIHYFGAACGAKAAGWVAKELTKAAATAQAAKEASVRRRLNELTAEAEELSKQEVPGETQPQRFSRLTREKVAYRAAAWQVVSAEDPEAKRPLYW